MLERVSTVHKEDIKKKEVFFKRYWKKRKQNFVQQKEQSKTDFKKIITLQVLTRLLIF